VKVFSSYIHTPDNSEKSSIYHTISCLSIQGASFDCHKSPSRCPDPCPLSFHLISLTELSISGRQSWGQIMNRQSNADSSHMQDPSSCFHARGASTGIDSCQPVKMTLIPYSDHVKERRALRCSYRRRNQNLVDRHLRGLSLVSLFGRFQAQDGHPSIPSFSFLLTF